MNKKVMKVMIWIMLIVMVGSFVASIVFIR